VYGRRQGRLEQEKYGNRRHEQNRTEIWKQKTRATQNRNMETEDKNSTEQKYGNKTRAAQNRNMETEDKSSTEMVTVFED